MNYKLSTDTLTQQVIKEYPKFARLVYAMHKTPDLVKVHSPEHSFGMFVDNFTIFTEDGQKDLEIPLSEIPLNEAQQNLQQLATRLYDANRKGVHYFRISVQKRATEIEKDSPTHCRAKDKVRCTPHYSGRGRRAQRIKRLVEMGMRLTNPEYRNLESFLREGRGLGYHLGIAAFDSSNTVFESVRDSIQNPEVEFDFTERVEKAHKLLSQASDYAVKFHTLDKKYELPDAHTDFEDIQIDQALLTD